jgi:hypothetical protein
MDSKKTEGEKKLDVRVSRIDEFHGASVFSNWRMVIFGLVHLGFLVCMVSSS